MTKNAPRPIFRRRPHGRRRTCRTEVKSDKSTSTKKAGENEQVEGLGNEKTGRNRPHFI